MSMSVYQLPKQSARKIGEVVALNKLLTGDNTNYGGKTATIIGIGNNAYRVELWAGHSRRYTFVTEDDIQ